MEGGQGRVTAYHRDKPFFVRRAFSPPGAPGRHSYEPADFQLERAWWVRRSSTDCVLEVALRVPRRSASRSDFAGAGAGGRQTGSLSPVACVERAGARGKRCGSCLKRHRRIHYHACLHAHSRWSVTTRGPEIRRFLDFLRRCEPRLTVGETVKFRRQACWSLLTLACVVHSHL